MQSALQDTHGSLSQVLSMVHNSVADARDIFLPADWSGVASHLRLSPSGSL